MTNQANLENNEHIDPIVQEQPLDNFLETAYRRYAILTILDRALPDVRDGLKPGQRRILYAMHSTGMKHSSPHRKSARVVGEVLGKYHPHGDASVYDAMVRMAQDFSMRSPLIDGQGNFGSIDGDSAAAMRYTEARLSEIGGAMLDDIDKDTVNWQLNFDDSLEEPVVLPARFPNLLVNGSSGIAVGMSTSILPHNLGEVCDAVIHLTREWKRLDRVSVDELMEFIPGPDLPTGGLLYRYRMVGDKQTDMIKQAYKTGNSTMVCQAKADIQDIGGGKSEIIITELPYQVQKTTVLERIASRRDKFTGLTDVRDESDYKGMRIVFEVARGTDPQDVLDRLLKNTQMRSSLSHNALALVREESENGQENNGKARTHALPRYLCLKDFLVEFIRHRLEVITRRSLFDLDKAETRQHIVIGLIKALNMIDEVIQIIRRSQTTDTARTNLMNKLSLSQLQAQAILDMPLRRLASLERKKLEEENKVLKAKIKELNKILSSEKFRLGIVAEEILDIKDRFETPRRTVIVELDKGHQAVVTVADLVLPQKTQIIVVSPDRIQRHNRGEYRDSTISEKPTSRAVEIPLLKAQAEPTDTLIIISNKGRMWKANIGRLPQNASFLDLGLEQNEAISGCGIAKQDHYLIITTSQGNIKRISIEDCLSSHTEASWNMIIGLQDTSDKVLFAGIGSNDSHVLIGTSGNKDGNPRGLRFESSGINPQGTPSARGVTAIKMLGDSLIGGGIIEPDDFPNSSAVILTANGHLKRLPLSDFPIQGRGGQGVLCWRPTPESGLVTGMAVGVINNSINIYSEKRKRLRLAMKNITKSNRSAKGVDLISLYGMNCELFPSDLIAGISIS
jgi:DNA gyrase subunit A